MKKRAYCFVDQYGHVIFARTVKDLRVKAGGGRVSKMYRDRDGEPPVHIGYVVGQRWFDQYAPIERPA